MLPFGWKRNRPEPVALHGNHAGKVLPDGVQLVAREDIFSNRGAQAVLLLRAGMVVEEDLLPKLIRHGAGPDQFVLKETGTPKYSQEGVFRQEFMESVPDLETPVAGEEVAELPASRINPMTDPAQIRSCEQSRNRIIIAESDERSLKRLMDTLFASGVRLADMHTVRLPDQLEWAMNKYRPAILFLDESMHPVTSVFPRLQAIREKFGTEQIALTVNILPDDEDHREALLEKAERLGIELIFKPVNRFALVSILKPYKARLAIQRSMSSNRNADLS